MMKPLAGLKVLDLSRLLAGPYCTQLLGDLGAGVIKVEPFDGDDARGLGPPFVDGNGMFFMSANGGKRSIAIDLTKPAGRDVVMKLAAEADVFVENFRPGIAEKLGISYADIRRVAPAIVYCSISGFGNSGSMSSRGGVDTIFQSMGGAVALINTADGKPVKVSSPIADIAAAQMSALAINAALIGRGKTGAGTHVQVAIRDALAALLTPAFTYALLTGQDPPSWGNASQFAAPADIFRTSDGYLALSAVNNKHWQQICVVLGDEELQQDARFSSAGGRIANREVLSEKIQQTLVLQPTRHWEDRFNAVGVPAGPILRFSDLIKDEQLAHNGLIIAAGDEPAVGLPFCFDADVMRERGSVPQCGEHTKSILESLGYSSETICSLAEAGVVRPSVAEEYPHHASAVGKAGSSAQI